MEPIEDIKDYRSLSESQLKAELKNLETSILEITHDPVDYHHYTPFLDWCGDEKAVEAIQEMMNDRCRILNLLFDIHCSRSSEVPIRFQTPLADNNLPQHLQEHPQHRAKPHTHPEELMRRRRAFVKRPEA